MKDGGLFLPQISIDLHFHWIPPPPPPPPPPIPLLQRSDPGDDDLAYFWNPDSASNTGTASDTSGSYVPQLTRQGRTLTSSNSMLGISDGGSAGVGGRDSGQEVFSSGSGREGEEGSGREGEEAHSATMGNRTPTPSTLAQGPGRAIL